MTRHRSHLDLTPDRLATGAFTLLALAAVFVGPLAPRATAQAEHSKAQDHWVGADKVKHFVASFMVQSVSYAALRTLKAPHGGALVGATAATAAVGLWKERYDRAHTGLFSKRDLTWDALGAAAATIVLSHSER